MPAYEKIVTRIYFFGDEIEKIIRIDNVSGEIIEKFPMAWSYILTIASLGSIIMPSIIGKIADKKGIGPGMASVAVVVLIDLVSIIGLVIYCKKKGEKVSL